MVKAEFIGISFFGSPLRRSLCGLRLRTEMPLRDIPVLRMAYFPIPHRPTFGAPVFRSAYSASRNARASAAFAASIKPHCGLFSKTLDLQVRFAHPPFAHHHALRRAGVPVGLLAAPNARPSGSLRSPSGGRGKLRSPPAPLSPAPGNAETDRRQSPSAGKNLFRSTPWISLPLCVSPEGLALPAHAAPTGGKTCSIHSRRNTLAGPGLFFFLTARSSFRTSRRP